MFVIAGLALTPDEQARAQMPEPSIPWGVDFPISKDKKGRICGLPDVTKFKRSNGHPYFLVSIRDQSHLPECTKDGHPIAGPTRKIKIKYYIVDFLTATTEEISFQRGDTYTGRHPTELDSQTLGSITKYDYGDRRIEQWWVEEPYGYNCYTFPGMFIRTVKDSVVVDSIMFFLPSDGKFICQIGTRFAG